MSTPTNPAPEPDPVVGVDSVLDIHRQLMAELNDASMTADGMPPEDEEPDTIQRLLAVIARENAEPRDGFEPVPFWVACVFGTLLAWGGYYLGTNTADFRKDVFDRSDLRMPEGGSAAANVPDPDPQTLEELMKIGGQKFQAVCASCHQPNGQGKPAENIPPLDGSEWLVGDQASAARQCRIVLYGLSGPVTVKGRTFNGVMPNQGNIMKDYEIAAVLTYARNSWSNAADKGKPPAITAATVRAARAKEGTRKTNGTQPVSAPELQKLPLDYSDSGATPTPEKKDEKKDPPKP
ncbi:MAG: cytochrome c [Planctomycetes bacterium]|nr:cytochrome c [Planctomycetota bacterium]